MSLALYTLPFYNNSGETVPPFSVMQVDEWKDDANDRDYFRIKKPDGEGKVFIINGPLEVPDDGDGMASRAPGIQASYNNAVSPAVDEEWGPVASSWLLTAAGFGFFIIGDTDTINSVNVVRVVQTAAGTGVNIVHGQAVGAVATTDATFTIDQIVLKNGVMPSGVDELSADTITVDNDFDWEIDDNGKVEAVQNDDETWRATQAKCPA